jgi:hypothetical protein
MRTLWKGLVAVGALCLGLWMHNAAAALATDAKLLLARALIWGSIAGGYALWLARRPIRDALARLAERVEQNRSSSLPRREDASLAERILIGLFVALCASLTITALVSPDTFVHLFREDGPFEMGTTIAYAISAAFCIALGLRASGHRRLQIALGFLATLFIVVGGEEISWGQRFFEFSTPESLVAINVQEEFTLHNIYSISLFTYPALATTAMLLLVAPLLRSRSPSARRIFDAFELPVAPPACADLYGVMIVAYLVVGLRLGTPTPLPLTYSKYVPHFDDEMMEFLISAMFMVFAVTNWRLQLPAKDHARQAPPAGSLSAGA